LGFFGFGEIMSLDELGLIDYEEVDKTLIIDGDIVVYQPCCIFNEDDDQSRKMIAKYINKKIDDLMEAAGCNTYIMFVTTNFNFRDFLVDDYKANRVSVDRPVNLAWAKKWAVSKLNNHFVKYLEADDLLGIHMNENTVLWSLDKDLRQIAGKHLDDATRKVITVTEEGTLREIHSVTEAGNKKKKVYFDGTVGFYYQLLICDSTDNILGCAIREQAVRKSGDKEGETYTRRKGVGSAQAIKLLLTAAMNKGDRTTLQATLDAVVGQYKKIHGADWQTHLETQANLLFMVRKQYGEVIQRWTYDGREEYFNINTGMILDEYNPEDAKNG
jgi:hypothetical protein